MGSDIFRFKQFEIKQADSAMKVGTDGIILGAWAKTIGSESKILDIGTGTGLLALMMAQRCPNATIHAVEIEPRAAQEAALNARNSPWADRITVFEQPFQQFAIDKANQGQKYDLIVSNPPYFNGTYKSVMAERTAARHVELLSSDDIINGVIQILDPTNGRFNAIFPYEVGAVFIAKAAAKLLYCNQICNITPKHGRQIKRIAAQFILNRIAPTQEHLTISNENNTYTPEFINLTQDFYIKF